jgi:hypothetical protein
LGVALFIWIFIGLLNFDVLGVWLGIAVAVSTGWLLSLLIAVRVVKSEIGGLLRAH